MLVYLVHDLGDAAVARRIRMLTSGGVEIALAGFRRAGSASAGTDAVTLGETFNGRLVARALLLLKTILAPRALLDVVRRGDAILARNLEMLILAVYARALSGRRMPVVYECLDIHALMFKSGPVGALVRGLERWLLKRVEGVIVSSPAFEREHFRRVQGFEGRVLLVENKVLLGAPGRIEADEIVGDVVRIGWFGMLRCQRSLGMLAEIVRLGEGRIEVDIRGRVALDVMPDFHEVVAATPGLDYLGSYAQDELGAIYAKVQFAWAIDYFEAGANSDWLLPNRIYEGIRHGAVPIALAGTEVARWLTQAGVGVVVEDPVRDVIELLSVTPHREAELRMRIREVDPALVEFTADDYASLVGFVSGKSHG